MEYCNYVRKFIAKFRLLYCVQILLGILLIKFKWFHFANNNNNFDTRNK